MNHITEATQWGSFALVSYIPDPLGSFLHKLRHSLPGEDNPQPHITILPPRPLKLPVEAASQQAQDILLQFPAFDVELWKVRSFPETHVLYLDLKSGNKALHDLHAALNAGELRHRETFDFLPHLTLGGPVALTDVQAVRERAEALWYPFEYPRCFLLDEIVFLWLSPDSSQGEWVRLWSQRLHAREATRAASAAVTTRTY